MSSSWGLRGGSWGRERAGGSNELTSMFCGDAIAVVENAQLSLGRVQIYMDESAQANGHVTSTDLAAACGLHSMSHWVFGLRS